MPLPSAMQAPSAPQSVVQGWEQTPSSFWAFAFKPMQMSPAHAVAPAVVGVHALPVGFFPPLLGQAPPDPVPTVTVAVALFEPSATLVATTWKVPAVEGAV
jgi:hypothetical protein